MVILVLNSGSSSIKYKLVEISKNREKVLDKGFVERIGEKIPDHKVALGIILNKIDIDIDACGHRVVHGGDRFKEATLISDGVIKAIKEFSQLAPLHNPPSLLTIVESGKLLSQIKHVAVFDTAFYQTIPQYAYLYAIPLKYHEKYKIRKYGFHGTSHRYVRDQAVSILKKSLGRLNLITVHLGSGCSITAIKNGKAIDTSMGFTPLEGLMMGTRSGDIDPAVIPYIMAKDRIGIDKVMEVLNKRSGLLGISGISNDMRTILKKSKTSKLAKLALDMFKYRIKKYISSYIGIIGEVNAVVFTGGIGENQPNLMRGICKGVLAKKTKILIVPTDEELMIARDTYNIVENKNM